MIELKEIKNRVYDHKTLVRFDVDLKIEEESYTVTFKKNINKDEWKLTFVLPRTYFYESKIYCINYKIPMRNPDLELIASTGLKMLQATFQEDVQKLSNLDFAIGNLIGE